MTKLKIKELCQKQGIKQTELAELLGVTKGAVSQLLSDDASPSLKTLCRVANVLGVGVKELIEDSPKESITEMVWGVIRDGDKTYTISSRTEAIQSLSVISNSVYPQVFTTPTDAKNAIIDFVKHSLKVEGNSGIIGQICGKVLFSISAKDDWVEGDNESHKDFMATVIGERLNKTFYFSSHENKGNLEYMFADICGCILLPFQDNDYGENL